MGNLKKVEKGCLLYFVLGVLISVIAGESPFAHGIEDVGVKARGIINDLGFSNKLDLPFVVIGEIGSNPQSENVFTFSQPTLEGDSLLFHGGHCQSKSLNLTM